MVPNFAWAPKKGPGSSKGYVALYGQALPPCLTPTTELFLQTPDQGEGAASEKPSLHSSQVVARALRV